jgi:phosphoglycolate phosphatase-like HAD superfamily hydrolase
MSKLTRRQSLALAVGFVLSVAAASSSGCASSPKASPPTITAAATSRAAMDPLPSWNDGAVKRGIIDFVARVTKGSPDFVTPEDRIAVFDNDGTLWQEKPLAEAAFTLARLTRMAATDPGLREKQPFKAALERDWDGLQEQGERAALELLTATHTGMTDDAYKAEVREFLGTARHPRFDAPYASLTYTPMLELLRYLRANGFTTYISSGGDVDFMRTFAATAYGIPPQQVIGSRFAKKLVTADGKTALLREPKLETFNDKEQKPPSIDRQIGKRPIFAAGNVRSGGDVAMLRYTRDRPGPTFALVINHDDAAREFSYAENDGATLTAANAGDFLVVSMQRDWKTIFGDR